MSKETAKKLIAELQTNEELAGKIAGMTDKEEMVKKAVKAGYDVTVEEMLEAEREFKEQIAQKTDAQSVELSADELETAAGGAHWQGEDAPDGKELGCEICNYKYDEMKEKNYWCKNDWYCNGTRGKYEPDCYNKGSHMGN